MADGFRCTGLHYTTLAQGTVLQSYERMWGWLKRKRKKSALNQRKGQCLQAPAFSIPRQRQRNFSKRSGGISNFIRNCLEDDDGERLPCYAKGKAPKGVRDGKKETSRQLSGPWCMLLVPRVKPRIRGRTDVKAGTRTAAREKTISHHGYPAHQHRDLTETALPTAHTHGRSRPTGTAIYLKGSVNCFPCRKQSRAETVAAMEEALEQAEDRYILACRRRWRKKSSGATGKRQFMAAIILGTAGPYLWIAEYRRRGMEGGKGKCPSKLFCGTETRADDIQQQLEAARQETEQTKGELKAARQETAQAKGTVGGGAEAKKRRQKRKEKRCVAEPHTRRWKILFFLSWSAHRGYARINGNKRGGG